MTQNPLDEKIIVRHQFVQIARKPPTKLRAIRAIRPTLPAVCIRGPSADDHCDDELLGFTARLAGIENRVNPVKVKIV